MGRSATPGSCHSPNDRQLPAVWSAQFQPEQSFVGKESHAQGCSVYDLKGTSARLLKAICKFALFQIAA